MQSIKIRTKQQNGMTQVRMLIDHPMETGRHRDEISGARVPAHFIETVTIEHQGKRVATAHFSTAVSKNPYLSLRFRGGQPGDRLQVTWVDNRGQKGSAETVIASPDSDP